MIRIENKYMLMTADIALFKKQRQLKNQMHCGAIFLIFGILCPFYWLNLFSGDSGFETTVYGVHSAFFIGIGLAIIAHGWYKHKQLPGS